MAVESCPGCGEMLVKGRRAGVFVCRGCAGRYLDAHALESFGLNVPADLPRRVPSKPRSCAECSGEMAQVVLSGVTLERCDPCGSLFFDSGELEALRTARASRGESLECDGCGQSTPIRELESRDGKALCRQCIAGDPRRRGTGISERDYYAAKQHASAERNAEINDRSPGSTTFDWGYRNWMLVDALFDWD